VSEAIDAERANGAAGAVVKGLTPEPALVVERSKAADAEAIESWVLTSPRTCFWHRPAWLRAVEASFAIPDVSLVAKRGGRVVGYLPLGLVETLTLEQNLVSVPFGVYGGPAGDDPEVEEALVERAMRLADAERVGCLELRQREPRAPRLPESDLYVTFVKRLPEKPEDALGMLPRKARAAARQGRDKWNLTFDDGLWYLDDFFHLFSRNKRHLGSPPLPREFFEILCQELAGSVYLHIVRQGTTPIAGVLSFRFKDTLLPYYSGGLASHEYTQCNNFMYWKLMEWGVERGFRFFDFGRSRRESGPFHFKVNQGFEPETLHYAYYLVRRGAPPRFNPSNPAFDMPRRIWQQLPLPLHEWLGARISRFLP
jgi:FemAB-related protein (PEP-CTERM system-associated)